MHIFQDKIDSNIARILIRKGKMFESFGGKWLNQLRRFNEARKSTFIFFN